MGMEWGERERERERERESKTVERPKREKEWREMEKKNKKKKKKREGKKRQNELNWQCRGHQIYTHTKRRSQPAKLFATSSTFPFFHDPSSTPTARWRVALQARL